jgi:hypothetical protein
VESSNITATPSRDQAVHHSVSSRSLSFAARFIKTCPTRWSWATTGKHGRCLGSILISNVNWTYLWNIHKSLEHLQRDPFRKTPFKSHGAWAHEIPILQPLNQEAETWCSNFTNHFNQSAMFQKPLFSKPWDFAVLPSGNLLGCYWKWTIYSWFSRSKWWFSMAFSMFTRPGPPRCSHHHRSNPASCFSTATRSRPPNAMAPTCRPSCDGYPMDEQAFIWNIWYIPSGKLT